VDGRRPALAVVVQCLLNAILVGAVVALSEHTSLRGQALGLLSSTGLPYLGQGFVAYLLYVLWIPVGFGPSTLIFGGPAILATRWQLSQYGAEQRARQGALAALQTAIDVRSPAAAQHTSEVAALCEGLAVALALPADEVDMLRTAGVLHNLDVLTVDRPTAGHGQGTALTTTRAMGQVTFLAAARPALEWQRIPYAARPAPTALGGDPGGRRRLRARPGALRRRPLRAAGKRPGRRGGHGPGHAPGRPSRLAPGGR
jgi:hypothetical protein